MRCFKYIDGSLSSNLILKFISINFNTFAKERFINDLDLTEYEADLLTSEKATADYFENVVDKLPEQSDRYKPIKTTSNFILGDLTALMKDTGENFSSCSLSPNYLAELVMTVVSGDISVNIAKNVLAESFTDGKERSSHDIRTRVPNDILGFLRKLTS